MSVILAHPTGSPNVRDALRGLHNAGLLTKFATTLAFPADAAWPFPLPAGMRRALDRRRYGPPPMALIRRYPWREATRLAAERLGWSRLVRHEVGRASVDAVYQGLDHAVARDIRRGTLAGRAVYAYDDGARETFRAAGERGMLRIYELPIADWRTVRAVLGEEAELQPSWAITLDALRDSSAKLARKDEEIQAADQILIPCSYARDQLIYSGQVAPARVHRLPYAAPPVPTRVLRERPRSAPLRIIYVGQLRQRKGMSYLFEAMRRLDIAHELTLIGAPPPLRCMALERELAKYRWLGKISNADVLAEMASQDVMVFPSLCEGFGLVILEAMAQGVPVITTPHTGGPDIIDDGIDGFIVPIRDPDAIAARLAYLAANSAHRLAMAEAARFKAASLGWHAYQSGLVQLVRCWLGEREPC